MSFLFDMVFGMIAGRTIMDLFVVGDSGIPLSDPNLTQEEWVASMQRAHKVMWPNGTQKYGACNNPGYEYPDDRRARYMREKVIKEQSIVKG